jgi:predicted AAA+ superfamily ATPase
MINRSIWIKAIENAKSRHKVVALVGPRQCGKITLAREFLQATSPGSLAMSTWRSKPQPLICN